MSICDFSVDEYIKKAKEFHGHLAPGMLCGGFMVDLAIKNLPEGPLYDTISETRACIPDSIQLLTPCTIGNGWMKIINTGRFALVFYDKHNGNGVRVALDPVRLKNWHEVHTWAMKLKPKKEQDKKRLISEIIEAGPKLYKIEPIHVDVSGFGKKSTIFTCDSCGESFRGKTQGICSACSGDVPFSTTDGNSPEINAISVDDAVGKTVLHDMTRIETGVTKGPACLKGDTVTDTDVSMLKSMGKNHVYISENVPENDALIHENDVAIAFAEKMSGPGTTYKAEPREGKIDFTAEFDGVIVPDTDLLKRFNRIPGVMCASRRAFTPVTQGQIIGGTRAIPLFLPKTTVDSAIEALDTGSLFSVAPYSLKNVGIIVTGTEVAEGRIKDSFLPVIEEKAAGFNCNITGHRFCRDEKEEISTAAKDLINEGAQVLVVTGGLSVDPDDVTRSALLDTGLTDELYGSPVLPGAMTLTGRIGNTRVIGVPAGALYFETTAFDLLFPRLLADLPLTRKELADLADGGFLDPAKRVL